MRNPLITTFSKYDQNVKWRSKLNSANEFDQGEFSVNVYDVNSLAIELRMLTRIALELSGLELICYQAW